MPILQDASSWLLYLHPANSLPHQELKVPHINPISRATGIIIERNEGKSQEDAQQLDGNFVLDGAQRF